MPDPVCPNAMTVALKPSSAASSSWLMPHRRMTSAWREVGPRQAWKVKVRVEVVPALEPAPGARKGGVEWDEMAVGKSWGSP